METTVYEWLLSTLPSSTKPIIIEYILILSVKGLFISHQQLLNCFDKLKTTAPQINNNNKRNNNFDNNDNYQQSLLYGLNRNDFQIIENSFNSFSTKNSNTNNSSNKDLVFNHKIENGSIDKFKFDCSISIIIENNKIHNSTNSQSIITTNLNLNKKIKTTNTNTITPTTTAITTNKDINSLFYKVWKNIVIRNEILFHTRLYNIHLNKTITLQLSEFTFPNITKSKYKYKSYIDKMILITDTSISFHPSLKPNMIPNQIREIELNLTMQLDFEIGCIPDSTTSLSINGILKKGFSFIQGFLSNNITRLSIDSDSFDQSLHGGWIPKNLVYLNVGNGFHQSILPGQLPESLTELILSNIYFGFISPGSIPIACKSLDYKFDSQINNNKLDIGYGYDNPFIPRGTIKLEFDDEFNQTIKVGLIPQNVQSIKFGIEFTSLIEPGSLPKSVTSLSFSCPPSYTFKNDMLPPTVTYIEFGEF